MSELAGLSETALSDKVPSSRGGDALGVGRSPSVDLDVEGAWPLGVGKSSLMGEVTDLRLSGSFGGGARRTDICGMSSITVLRKFIFRACRTAGSNVVGGSVGWLAMLMGLDLSRCCLLWHLTPLLS